MRVLIVEDEPELRQAIGRRLKAAGHGVDQAISADEAESFLASYPYDVIVLDRGLPDGDSLDRLRRWRAGGNTTPVLFLTARDRVQDRVTGLEAGADDYLVKPFAMEELVARLAAIARRGETIEASVVRIGDLEIDSGRREVRRGEVLLPLRPKEWTVLQVLAAGVGRVVSRREIRERCWGEEDEPVSNVEEVVVAALRKKLGTPPVIRTIRGGGYLLESPE